jgi:adenylate kinase family enzyme
VVQRVSIVGNAGSGKSTLGRKIAAAISAPFIDGNYRAVIVDGVGWKRADTVIWFDLPRHVVMRQVITRSLRRAFTRDELWNGNREELRNLFSWDPTASIIRWAWTQHAKYLERYGSAMLDERYAHIRFIRLRSHHDGAVLVASLQSRGAADTPVIDGAMRKSLDEGAIDPSV